MLSKIYQAVFNRFIDHFSWVKAFCAISQQLAQSAEAEILLDRQVNDRRFLVGLRKPRQQLHNHGSALAPFST